MEPQFLTGSKGSLFVIYHPPIDIKSCRGSILYFPPFAEEMNKARRMAALQAQRFSQAGFAVLLPDLYGCGDSSGDFADARWQIWLDDLQRCIAWLQLRHDDLPLYFWGLRAGALLATSLLANNSAKGLLLWQPISAGSQLLTQFLRLRLAATLASGSKETSRQLREQLQAGISLEIAGYELHSELATALDQATSQMPPITTRVHWLEVVSEPERPILPTSQRVIDNWRSENISVGAATVAGASFWATQEIALAPTLLETSVNSLEAMAKA